MTRVDLQLGLCSGRGWRGCAGVDAEAEDGDEQAGGERGVHGGGARVGGHPARGAAALARHLQQGAAPRRHRLPQRDAAPAGQAPSHERVPEQCCELLFNAEGDPARVWPGQQEHELRETANLGP